MGLIETRVYIDFDNDLSFEDADEDISDYVTHLVIERAISDELNAGSLELAVNDADGRFQPQFAGGPYGSGLTVGRRVKVVMKAGVQADMFYGFITEISPEYVAAEEEDPQRSILATDLLGLLSIRRLTTGTLLGKQTGEIVNRLLDNLGWEPDVCTLNRSYLDTPSALLGGGSNNWRYVDDGQMAIPYCQWKDTAITAAIQELVEAEHGGFWIGKDGWVHYEDRHHRNADRTSLSEVDDSNIAEMVLRYSDEQLFNHVDVTAHPRSVGTADSVIFDAIGEGNNGQKLMAGESREYNVSYTEPETGDPCEATNIITPVAPTDYAANSKADGTGTDMTGSLGVTFEADENERYKFTLINNHSTQDIYVTKLQVRGTPLIAHDAVTMTATDELSVIQYLQRDMAVDNSLLSNPLEADDYAKWLLYQHKEPAARIEQLTLLDSNYENARHIISRELSDRVTVKSDKYHLDGGFFIDGIKLETDLESGQVRCDWTLNGLAARNLFFILDADQLDSAAVLGY